MSDDPDRLEVPVQVWLVIEPMVGTPGAIRAFRSAAQAKAFAGKKGKLVTGPYTTTKQQGRRT